MLSTALFYEVDAGIVLRGATTYTNNSEKQAALLFTERMSSNVAHGDGLILVEILLAWQAPALTMSFKGKDLLKIACLEVLKMGEWL